MIKTQYSLEYKKMSKLDIGATYCLRPLHNNESMTVGATDLLYCIFRLQDQKYIKLP